MLGNAGQLIVYIYIYTGRSVLALFAKILIIITILTFDIRICCVATWLSGTISRCFMTDNYEYLVKIYITYIRALLLYKFCMWDPGILYKSYCNKLERIQQFFHKTYFDNCSLPTFSYTNDHSLN